MDTFSDLQRQGSTVGKHVRLMSEINRLVDARRLLDISELEQNLVVTTSQSAHFMAVRDMITSRPPIEDFDALRLVLIYALRYQSDTESIHVLKDMLVTRGIGRSDVALVDAFMAYGAAAFRSTGLFGTESVFKQLSKSMSRSIRGVQNVFAQHEPLVHEIMTDLTKGRLAKPQYPFVGTELPPGELGVVVIFVLGGVTYEESVFVARANTAAADAGLATRFILAGTAIHNSRSFLADLRRRAGAPEDAAAGAAGAAAGGGGAGGAVVATAGGARARGGSSDASSSSSVSVRIGRP
jgi:vacuolar protein sorting-associated protein 45